MIASLDPTVWGKSRLFPSAVLDRRGKISSIGTLRAQWHSLATNSRERDRVDVGPGVDCMDRAAGTNRTRTFQIENVELLLYWRSKKP